MAERIDCDRVIGADLRTGPLRVEALTSCQRFVRLQRQWDSLFNVASEAFPTTSHAWLRAWWEAFGAGRQPYIILVWEGDVLIGAAPFHYDRKEILRTRLRVLRPWVNDWVDRFTFLATFPETAVVDAILGHLDDIGPAWDLIELPRLDRDSALTERFLQSCHRRGLSVGVEDDLQSPVLQLPSSWDALLLNLSPSFRQTLKRKMRAVEKMRNVRMSVLKDESAIAPIVEISRESWQHVQGTSIASKQDIQTFYQTVIKNYAQRQQVYCALMEVAGEPAAFELNLAHNRTLHNFKLGFKKKFSHMSTGVVLKAFLLQQILDTDGAEPEFTEYDFMGTAEDYKLRWSKSLRVQNRYLVFSRHGPARRVYKWLYVVRPYMRDHLPAFYRVAKKVRAGIQLRRA